MLAPGPPPQPAAADEPIRLAPYDPVCSVLVGCYYGYTASGGPVGVGTATAKSMVVNIIMVHIVGMLGTLIFYGSNPRAPIGG